MAERDKPKHSIWKRELKGPFWDLFEKLAWLGCGCEGVCYLTLGAVALINLLLKGCER